MADRCRVGIGIGAPDRLTARHDSERRTPPMLVRAIGSGSTGRHDRRTPCADAGTADCDQPMLVGPILARQAQPIGSTADRRTDDSRCWYAVLV
ncbi:MAG: hypothetical protein P4L81_03770 [Candidatus Pacebacteria bacterium]|nr:hypothetical protein [Candidatus Paceibacterota bacterium]